MFDWVLPCTRDFLDPLEFGIACCRLNILKRCLESSNLRKIRDLKKLETQIARNQQ